MIARDVMLQILDLARWAPSGDNTQPWRFEIIDEHNLVVHGFDTREYCVYDLDGRPSQISIGALLETISIAASGHRLTTRALRRTNLPDTTPTFDVRFSADLNLAPDPLIASITRRCVQRRPMSFRSLTLSEKQILEASVGPDFRLQWLESFSERTRAAWMMFKNAKLRLTLPEAYQVHRDVIQWSAQFSEDRVPDQALGVDPVTLRLMHFVMGSWRRVEFFNKYLAGTLAPRVQMDLIPGLACAAHIVIKSNRLLTTVDDFVAAGRVVQRFWLTLTRLELFQQPEMTPLIFGSYVRSERPFTSVVRLQEMARDLEGASNALLGPDVERAVWMGRVGAGSTPSARSIRRPLEQLIHA
jgi:hypothetical protein